MTLGSISAAPTSPRRGAMDVHCDAAIAEIDQSVRALSFRGKDVRRLRVHCKSSCVTIESRTPAQYAVDAGIVDYRTIRPNAFTCSASLCVSAEMLRSPITTPTDCRASSASVAVRALRSCERFPTTRGGRRRRGAALHAQRAAGRPERPWPAQKSLPSRAS